MLLSEKRKSGGKKEVDKLRKSLKKKQEQKKRSEGAGAADDITKISWGLSRSQPLKQSNFSEETSEEVALQKMLQHLVT